MMRFLNIREEKSKIDNPIYDLYNLYLNHYLDFDFNELFINYESKYPLLNEERILLFSLLTIPWKFEFNDTEYNLYGIKRNQTYKKPKNVELMVEYSKKLASAFKFVRVDFYEVNDKVYIGELTFTPGAMVFHYKNYDDEKYIGEFLKIK